MQAKPPINPKQTEREKKNQKIAMVYAYIETKKKRKERRKTYLKKRNGEEKHHHAVHRFEDRVAE